MDDKPTVENIELRKEHWGKSQDVAAQFVADGDSGATLTPELEKKCLRRIDWVLMPVMAISFGLQYMDKACLTGAALFGIIPDLKLFETKVVNGAATLSLQRYSYASLIFYWGYLVGLVPGVILSQRLPIAKYVGVAMIIWGGITVLTITVQSYPGLLAQRFFLGMTEAGISPAFSLITTMWYKRQEQPLRFAFWYSATGLGTLVGSLLLYVIGKIDGRLPSWKYQFMIIGSVTSVWGFVVLAVLPDSPVTAKFLNRKLKVVAVERMRSEQIGIENKVIKMYQIKETLLDPKTWLVFLLSFSVNFTNGALGGFGTVITTSFGYSQFRSILLISVVGAVIFISLLASGLISVYVRNMRLNCALFCCLPIIAGSAMIWKSTWVNKAVPLWGLFLLGFFPAVFVMVLSVIGANTAGHTKKAMTAGLVWLAYCIANGSAPLTVLAPEQKDHYPTAFRVILGLTSFSAALIITLRLYLDWQNRVRDARHPRDEVAAAATAFLDLTDGENIHFRFQT